MIYPCVIYFHIIFASCIMVGKAHMLGDVTKFWGLDLAALSKGLVMDTPKTKTRGERP
jgi:hypothetical protein